MGTPGGVTLPTTRLDSKEVSLRPVTGDYTFAGVDNTQPTITPGAGECSTLSQGSQMSVSLQHPSVEQQPRSSIMS